MIITAEQFQKYTGVFSDNVELQESYLQSAQEMVADFLGYNPEKSIYINDVLVADLEMPEVIKMTIMRIAALLQTEADGNIGVTSKSFGDSGTRTFLNTVNFDKYLIQISKYKLIRI